MQNKNERPIEELSDLLKRVWKAADIQFGKEEIKNKEAAEEELRRLVAARAKLRSALTDPLLSEEAIDTLADRLADKLAEKLLEREEAEGEEEGEDPCEDCPFGEECDRAKEDAEDEDDDDDDDDDDDEVHMVIRGTADDDGKVHINSVTVNGEPFDIEEIEDLIEGDEPPKK